MRTSYVVVARATTSDDVPDAQRQLAGPRGVDGVSGLARLHGERGAHEIEVAPGQPIQSPAAAVDL